MILFQMVNSEAEENVYFISVFLGTVKYSC